jgi:hypothetical protein
MTRKEKELKKLLKTFGHRSLLIQEQTWFFESGTGFETKYKVSVFLTAAEQKADKSADGIRQFEDATMELAILQAVTYMTALQKEVMKNGNPE